MNNFGAKTGLVLGERWDGSGQKAWLVLNQNMRLLGAICIEINVWLGGQELGS